MNLSSNKISVGPAPALSLALGFFFTACDKEADAPPPASAEDSAPAAAKSDEKIGYDLRLVRPQDESLEATFDRLRGQSLDEQKRVAVLFSADWCESCQRLDGELGNLHPAEQIGDVRIFMFKEEQWEAASRMNEFNGLRLRWEKVVGTYPLFVILDQEGQAQEEMKQAIDRLEGEGLKPSVENWFNTSRASMLR